ncbi:MAG: complex I subunit 5 family protein, partial [Armatimonadota bacterium]
MTGADLVIVAVVVLMAGAGITALTSRNRVVSGYVAFLCALVAAGYVTQVSLLVLADGPLQSASPLFTVPWVETSLTLEVDELGAVFLLLTALSAVCSTLYSIRYMPHHREYSVVRYYPMLLIFFASIFALLSVHNLFFFVAFWEAMTLTSYALVVFEKRDAEVRRAGLIYFVMSQAAVLLMIVAVAILHSHTPTGSFALADFRQVLATLAVSRPWLAHLCIGLFMVAAATKSGILPFGVWLPHAHPAAPSPFSAVMSGCMVKMGVYRCLLVLLVLMPLSGATAVWGVLAALFGVGSMVVGTFTALQQSDTKRLLAFHTIGQMGYIWLAIGVGVTLLATRPELAAVALIAALFHTVNHSAFKALLFFTAGSALYRTGTRDLDKAGGLMHIMPLTTVTAVVGSLSISGIPGFNGFASKWLIIQSSLLAGFQMPLMVFLGIVAVFISAITLASFVK